MKTSKQLRREITELQKQLTLAEQAEQQIDAAADAGIPPKYRPVFSDNPALSC